MIFSTALRRELSYTSGAVFLVLLTIMLSTQMIRILGYAASGRVNPADVAILIGLGTLGYLAILLAVSMFIAILIVLTRWYRDAEMVIWFSSGVGLYNFIAPVLRFAAPIITLIALLALFVWPWANQQSNLLAQRFSTRDDVSLITPGQFRESPQAQRVFFVESVSKALDYVENIFITETRNGKLGVIISHTGTLRTDSHGDRYLVLNEGRRYEGVPGRLDFRIVEFEHYAAKIQSKANRVITSPDAPRNINTNELIASPTPPHLGELLWRIGLPILALVLALLAIPLAYVNPRQGRYHSLIAAVLIYLIYSNLLNLSQTWVAHSKLSFSLGWWPIHLGALLICLFLFWIRRTNASFSQRVLGLFLRRR